MGSSGPYGVYHSAFDNFAWFKKFADPDFVYEQEMARVFGLEAVRMADADVLPYDYEEYGKEIVVYIETARKRAEEKFGNHALDFAAVNAAARRFEAAGVKMLAKQKSPLRRCGAAEPGFARDGTGAADAARSAASAVVSPRDLCAR